MPADKTKFTHDAYIFKSEGVRRGRRVGYWEKEGYAREEPDGSLFVYLHSTPIGGFDGRIRCYRYGTDPSGQQPGADKTGDEGEGEGEEAATE
jgi:hypothetical protein